jgi:hypothetical protein
MVDPFSLSLLSLGISSMAIRRIVQVAEEQSALLDLNTDGSALARKLLLHAIAETSLRQGSGTYVQTLQILSELIELPEYAGLHIDTNVRLDKVFELEGDEIEDVISILSRRKVEAVIYDAAGMPVAALCQPQGEAGPPPLIRRLFTMTGLPIVFMPVDVDWREGMCFVERAFGLGEKAGISEIKAA